jgi:predicted deacylase
VTRHVAIILALLVLALAEPPVAAAPARQTVAEIIIGASGQGRPITALRVGDGPRKIVLVGATHGFPEANTYQLSLQLADYFRANPQAVPQAVRLYIVPLLNPDGLALGTRFNARGVDLNRNMNTDLDACPENDWQVSVFGARGIVSDTGGPYADSEIESRVIRTFLLDAAAVIFFHSSAGNVFPAACEHAPSIRLAQVYADSAGYEYARFWEAYTITGGMHDWAASLGIAAIIPELLTGDLPEFEQNLAGVLGVLARAEELAPLPEGRVEAGFAVPAPIWRFWRAHGGFAVFGRPLGPAERTEPLVRQVFERTVLELHEDQADTPEFVQLAPLGRSLVPPAPPSLPLEGGRFFPETGQRLGGGFLTFWERGGGLAVFGYPLTGEQRLLAADGRILTTQIFERAVFAYDAESGVVRLEPLGWAALVRERSLGATAPHQAR